MPNVQNMTLLYERIAGAPPEAFDMSGWSRGNVFLPVAEWPACGTAACLGGHAECLMGYEADWWEIGEWLGLSLGDAYELFFANWFTAKTGLLLSAITREHALAHLRDLIDGATVDWTRYVGRAAAQEVAP